MDNLDKEKEKLKNQMLTGDGESEVVSELAVET